MHRAVRHLARRSARVLDTFARPSTDAGAIASTSRPSEAFARALAVSRASSAGRTFVTSSASGRANDSNSDRSSFARNDSRERENGIRDKSRENDAASNANVKALAATAHAELINFRLSFSNKNGNWERWGRTVRERWEFTYPGDSKTRELLFKTLFRNTIMIHHVYLKLGGFSYASFAGACYMLSLIISISVVSSGYWIFFYIMKSVGLGPMALVILSWPRDAIEYVTGRPADVSVPTLWGTILALRMFRITAPLTYFAYEELVFHFRRLKRLARWIA